MEGHHHLRGLSHYEWCSLLQTQLDTSLREGGLAAYLSMRLVWKNALFLVFHLLNLFGAFQDQDSLMLCVGVDKYYLSAELLKGEGQDSVNSFLCTDLTMVEEHGTEKSQLSPNLLATTLF